MSESVYSYVMQYKFTYAKLEYKETYTEIFIYYLMAPNFHLPDQSADQSAVKIDRSTWIQIFLLINTDHFKLSFNECYMLDYLHHIFHFLEKKPIKNKKKNNTDLVLATNG